MVKDAIEVKVRQYGTAICHRNPDKVIELPQLGTGTPPVKQATIDIGTNTTLLLVAEGHPVAEAARRCRVDRSSVHRWLMQYRAEHEATALIDRPRSGRPRRAGSGGRGA